MLCCDTCGGEVREVEDLAVFVSQLAAAGVEARVHVRSVPQGLGRNLQFDLAPYLIDRSLTGGDRMVLLNAHRLSDEKLISLRRLAAPGVACSAFGAVPTRQSALGLKAKLAYVFGTEPDLHNLCETGDEDKGARLRGPVFGVARRTTPARVPRVLLVEPNLADAREAAGLVALALSRRFRVAVLTDGRAKREWQSVRGVDVPIYHYGEVLPADLAEKVEISASFTTPEGNYRLECLVANLARSAAVLLDATAGHAIAATSDAFVRAPIDVATLAAFLEAEILPNRTELGRRTAASRSAGSYAAEAVLRQVAAVLDRPVAAAPVSRLTFVPTNGIGLGHAQRCALIAQELATCDKPVFAAFPSCTRLVKSYGFDVMPMVARSAFHSQSFENDLANYVRLRALTAGGGTLVFDGGYIFDSIYRTILENRLRGVWIRRGLWQVAQNNSVALDREKVFDRIIVPREAFDELNVSYSHGDHVREVGPIVQRTALRPEDRHALRAALAERYGLGFDRLAVSLLGGGVAADRNAQIQALCGIMERRPDTLHLVVVWPGGRQEPGWFGWQRTRVVRTQRAATLLAAADLCIGAAGYNLFHEVLYNRTPTIFLPQTGPFMDDQLARGRAASERGLAALVEARELMRLEREVSRQLDGGEAEALAERLAAASLPEPGNDAAARCIEELHHGDAGMLCDNVAHFTASRR